MGTNRDVFVGIIIIIALIFTIVWGIHIIKKQIEFDNSCKDSCLKDEYYTEYETKFNSIPWNNLNGKCICKRVLSERIELDKLLDANGLNDGEKGE